jgi:thiol-disulfide isomerase/thioredoxin
MRATGVLNRIVGCAVAVLLAARPAGADTPATRFPAFSVQDLDGRRVTLTSVLSAGKPVVISFFATWCKPCALELPHLQAFASSTAIPVYLVSIDTAKPAVVSQFVSSLGVTLPVLLDPGARMLGEPCGVLVRGVAQVPRLMVLDADGIIRHVQSGFDPQEDFVASLASRIPAAPQRRRRVTLLLTNSTNGYLESCDCPTHPYGGLVRRATYLRRIRQADPHVLVLDSGDLLPPFVSDAHARAVLAAYALMEYDAVGIGDQELAWKGFIPAISTAPGDAIPFLLSNIVRCEDNACHTIAPMERLLVRDGIRFLVLAITDPDTFALYPERVTKHLEMRDARSVLGGLADARAGEYDVLIVLSHAGFDRDRELAAQFPYVDIIVGGHSQTLLKEPVRVGRTLIAQAGRNGEHVLKLDLEFAAGRGIARVSCEAVPLLKEIPDDPDIRRIADAYLQSLRSAPVPAPRGSVKQEGPR